MLPANIRWILFDAVGTLLYPDPPVADVYQAIAGQFGSRLSLGEIRQRFGVAMAAEFARGDTLERPPTNETGERERWRRIVAAVLHDVAEAGEQPFELLWQHFAQPSSWRLFDDVPKALAALANREFQLGIASNFDSRLLGIVQALPPLAVCRRTFVSSELGFCKPDARFFAAALSQLAVAPDQILLVGDDRINDFVGASAAGWQAVLIERDGEPAATGSLKSLAELLD